MLYYLYNIQRKLFFDEITDEDQTKYNPNWSYAPDHLYRTLIIGCSGSGKINSLLKSNILSARY